MRFQTSLIAGVLCLVSWVASAAAACLDPEVDGLVPYTCRGQVKVCVAGDSFVAGVRDNTPDVGLGKGYVERIRLKYPNATVVSYPKPGIISGALLAKLKQHMPSSIDDGPTKNLLDCDYFIVDVGRNDYWEDNDPGETVKNLVRITTFIRDISKKKSGKVPFVMISTLAPTTRKFQAGFIEQTNMKMLKYKGKTLPVYIRQDKSPMKKSLISKDGIHPNTSGYTVMAYIIEKFLEVKGKPTFIKSQYAF